MSPLLASFLACLSVALISSSGGGDSGGPKERRLDSARLAELELTYEIRAQVRQPCAEAGPPYPAGGPNGGHWAAFIQVRERPGTHTIEPTWFDVG